MNDPIDEFLLPSLGVEWFSIGTCSSRIELRDLSVDRPLGDDRAIWPYLVKGCKAVGARMCTRYIPRLLPRSEIMAEPADPVSIAPFVSDLPFYLDSIAEDPGDRRYSKATHCTGSSSENTAFNKAPLDIHL